jgi:hypothetical protein
MVLKNKSNFYKLKLLMDYLEIGKGQNVILRFNLKKFIRLYIKFWYGLSYKSLILRIGSPIKKINRFKGTKKIRSLSGVFFKILNSICSIGFFFNWLKFILKKESGQPVTLVGLKNYSIFLFKHFRFRELSSVLQSILTEISYSSINNLSFLEKKKTFFSICWDPMLRLHLCTTFLKNNFKQSINLKIYILSNCLLQKKKINIDRFMVFFISTILFFSGIFSLGGKLRTGEDNLINFTLFFRKIYLKRFYCMKNLV